MSIFGLFRSEEEVQELVLQNARLMMADRGYHLQETTGGRGQYIEASVHQKQKQLVLLIVEQREAAEKKELEQRSLELASLFLQHTNYRYCVFVHRRSSFTQKQHYSLVCTIRDLLLESTTTTTTVTLPPFQLFSRKFFHISLPRHELQPHFLRITDAQFRHLMGALTLEGEPLPKEKLSRLLWHDPIRRYYNYPQGAIILVVRDGECTVQSVRFRIVVKA